MRTILFFDLPSVSSKDTREYTRFVKTIKKEGFVMLQESVYTKLSINQFTAESSIKKIRSLLPPEGFVSVLLITEKQFASMINLLGESKSDVIATDEKEIFL